MDKLDRKLVSTGLRKEKKKQVKDEADRLKQAEKKKRRLEKALATSLAIRSELEKKKLKKMEEQQRLDEEGAATAEAVALHVLIGEEDTYESPSHLIGYSPELSIGESRRISYSYSYRNCWNDLLNGMPYSSGNHGTEELEFSPEDSAALIAAHAVSSLCIADNTQSFFPGQNAATTAINGMVPGHDFDRHFKYL